jgi:ribosomal protein L7/L12
MMELSSQVKALLHAGQKIEAIKQLRLEQHLGLKEAKDIVDEYARQHPELIRESDSGGVGSLLLVLAIAGVAVYWFINKG